MTKKRPLDATYEKTVDSKNGIEVELIYEKLVCNWYHTRALFFGEKMGRFYKFRISFVEICISPSLDLQIVTACRVDAMFGLEKARTVVQVGSERSDLEVDASFGN